MSAAVDYRTARMSDLTERVRRSLRPPLRILSAILFAATLYLLAIDHRGGAAFGLISLGSLGGLWIWSTRGDGVPLLPVLLGQQLFLYGAPILVNGPMMAAYDRQIETQAGVAVLVFSAALTLGWMAGMAILPLSPPYCYALAEFRREGASRLRKVSLILIVATTAYQVLERSGLADSLLAFLPAGATSIIWALLSAAASCGLFIGALLIGSGEMRGLLRPFFWAMLALNCYIAASSFLLSAACIFVLSVAIGLFWSRGRIPWRFLLVIAAIFSFLNVGKTAMRDRYWHDGGATHIPDFTLGEMPAHYAEWAGVSLDLLTGGGRPAQRWQAELGGSAAEEPNQTLLDRINNLQNLLYVLRAEERQHIAPLDGASYAVIPALLVPRILNAQKLRTHEGQVMLNVHFQRQDLASTEETYIAWGLLPEAVGNFGPWVGAVLIGSLLGFLCAWLEQWTARKLVVSLEGFIGFTIFLGLANSYEMVASVLVTSLFQALVPVAVAMLPLSRRIRVPPRAA